MGEDLFRRAIRVGLSVVREWLPDGKQDGDEWVALNPTRNDHNPGSFRINTTTGAWADFATDDARGNDAVSLYAYLHKSTLEDRARVAGYKNVSGGTMVEAAKEILLTYDPVYFPSDNDDFKIPKAAGGKSDFWEGYTYVERGIDNPPELDVSWYAKNWGEPSARWEFKKADRIVLYVCRFVGRDGKKDDRPFTLWTNGKDYKWRSKAPQNKYTLWNVDALEIEPNAPVLLTEGQKAASVVDPILSTYVCVGWYGGTNAIDKQDWEPLRGREVWFPFDADGPGRKALKKIRAVADEYDILLHPIYPPLNVRPGWDIADAVADGWDEQKIISYIEGAEEPDSGTFLDDPNGLKFKILGYSGDAIAFYPYGARKIIKHRAASLSKGVLMALMDREVWAEYFRNEDGGGIKWDAAINYVLRQAEQCPIFHTSRVRGTGVWKDDGQIVANTGEYLLIDGVRHELYDTSGDFVYERGDFVPYGAEKSLTSDEAHELIQTLDLIDWKHKSYSHLLAGWITLAPFGGALRWRPHVWVTGPKGSGKSWILEHIAYPLVGNEFGIMGFGTSTPAGIRDNLHNSAVATIMDEMESDNQKYAEYIDQNLKMFREGSSGAGQGASTLHGTQDGEGRQWIVQSMALFASIGAGITHGADRSRFTLLTVNGPGVADFIGDREERFRNLEQRTSIFTRPWSRAYHSRTYEIFNEVSRCIKIMTAQATELLGNRRDGDQLGTLFAGAWMSFHNTSCSAAEAREYLLSIGITEIMTDASSKADEELVLDEILSARIEIAPDSGPSKRATIGACLSYWYNAKTSIVPDNSRDLWGIEPDKLRQELEQYGIKPHIKDDSWLLQIATPHPAIRRFLRDTPWSAIYGELLGRLHFCDDLEKGPSRFAGVAKRYREMNVAEMFDDIPF